MVTGRSDDTSGSYFDDLVLVVDVQPGPEFTIVEVGGQPVAEGTVSPKTAAGVALSPLVTVSETSMVHLRRAWETREPQRYAVDRPHGRYDVYVSPVVGATGECRLVVHMADRHDRAERRRNIVNAAIVDALPGSVALLDDAGVIRAVNAGWVRFGLERSHDGVLADAGTNYLEVTDRAASSDLSARDAAEAIRSVMAGEVELATAGYPTEGSGSDGWYTMRVAPVDVDGERWVVVSHEDVTALRHALDRWHSTFSSAAMATLIVDRGGEVIDANAAFAALVGIDVARVLRRRLIDFVHPDDHGEVRRTLQRVRAGTPALTDREVRVLAADGSTSIVRLVPSSLSPDATLGAIVQLVDLTPQRRAEARLALQRELLELVAAGTPLPEVATAVALSIGRAIDGARGVVRLGGAPPFTCSDLPATPDLPRTWRVPIDSSTRAIGAVEIVSGVARRHTADDEQVAEMLASIVRLALQRDETATSLAVGSAAERSPIAASGAVFGGELARSIERLAGRQATVAVLAVGPIDFDALLGRAGWRGADEALSDVAATVGLDLPPEAVVTRRSRHVLALVEVSDVAGAMAIGSRIASRDDVVVGIACTSTTDVTTDDLLGQADEALAVARRRSDRLAVFGADMGERTVDDDAADDLRRALRSGEVSVEYQPVVDLRTGATTGLEALVRWHHPARGAVPPPELIHVAETSGLIHELGALVLHTACRDLARLRHDGAASLTVAVNLSARQLEDPDLVAVVRRALDEAALEPAALVVEITESVVVDDVDVVAAALAALRDLGVRVAIDDFGTGYSTLLYLKRFPADVLKIDQSFVQGLGVHDGDMAIVEAIVGLGHRLGLEVVAEGVETGSQLSELRRHGCDQAQGYLLQRPVPAVELARFLRSGTVDLGPEPAAPRRDRGVSAADGEQIDELLTLVTHELSTPLSVIGGHAELLADLLRRDGERPAGVLGALERNIRNLDELLRSLSGLSHALGQKGATATVEMVRFVEQTVHDLGPLLAQHDLGLSLPDRLVSSEIEPVAVRQILTNLLSNAVKFTEPSTKIEVGVRTAPDACEVYVADHGRGIPVERAAELFSRFARLGSRERGLGLGLHLSRLLARRQGGDLVHQETPGGGATFVLRLPA